MRLLYASPATTTTELARHLIDIFSKSQGAKKGVLLQKLEEAESSAGDSGKKNGASIVVNHDYKLARGLSELQEDERPRALGIDFSPFRLKDAHPH